MTKKETLKWRLGKLPSPDEVLSLVKDKIITQEEAREILFSTEKEEERDEASLKAEIKFLRELVDKLANKKPDRIVEVIKDVEIRYIKQPWVNPYITWCSTGGNGLITSSGSGTMFLSSTTDATNCAFTNIKTF